MFMFMFMFIFILGPNESDTRTFTVLKLVDPALKWSWRTNLQYHSWNFIPVGFQITHTKSLRSNQSLHRRPTSPRKRYFLPTRVLSPSNSALTMMAKLHQSRTSCYRRVKTSQVSMQRVRISRRTIYVIIIQCTFASIYVFFSPLYHIFISDDYFLFIL